MGQTGNNVAPAGRMAGFCRFGSDGGPVLWRARGGLERWALHEWKKSENTWRMNGSHPQLGPFHTGLVFIFFFMRTIFKVFIEFVTILLLFYVLVFLPQCMCEFSSLTRDRTCTPCIGRQNLNNWMITREVPATFLVYDMFGISWVWCHWNTKIRNNLFCFSEISFLSDILLEEILHAWLNGRMDI